MAKDIYDPQKRPDYLLYRNFQQSMRSKKPDTKIAWKEVTASPEMRFATDLTNLMATIPSRIFQCDDVNLSAFVDENGATTFCFKALENAQEPEMAKKLVIELNDELREFALYGDIDGILWNRNTKSITAKTPSDLFEIFVNIRHYLSDFNNNMTTVLFSSAVSIYEDYQAAEEDYFKKLHSPDEQTAIVRALKSIVSTFDDTLDFTVIPSDEINEDTGEVVFNFEIGLGSNSPISFEKRFQTLFQIFDDFDAIEELLSPSTQIALGGCQTCFLIETTDLKSLFRPIVFLFNNTDLMKKAKDNKARLFINPSELYSKLNDPNKGRRFAAFQH